MKIHFNKNDYSCPYNALPEQITLFVDVEKHIAAHAIKGPDSRYCAYIECPHTISGMANQLVEITWPIDGQGYADSLPGGVPKAFEDTSVIGWDYGHPEYHKDKLEWNNLKTVMKDCMRVYSKMTNIGTAGY